MRTVLLLSSVLVMAQAGGPLRPDPPIVCSSCDEWNEPLAPFRIFANTYYVGVAGLSALLITSDAGHILLDAALPQSATLIDQNIRRLGFRPDDIRLIVNSHAHFDHAGGIAALQRLSGAVVATGASGATALKEGMPTPDDPQRAYEAGFPKVANVRAVADGEVLRVGPLVLTAHATPGHTPGSTTWSWRSCQGTQCLDIVYADSLNAVSAPGFRFTGDATHPSLVESFRRSIATVEALPCDIIVSVHPGFTGIAAKLLRRAKEPETNPFIDPNGCRAYAAAARKGLEQRIAEEQKPPLGD